MYMPNPSDRIQAIDAPTMRGPARSCGDAERFLGLGSLAMKHGAMYPMRSDATSGRGWCRATTRSSA
jgi:hypothetical protein